MRVRGPLRALVAAGALALAVGAPRAARATDLARLFAKSASIEVTSQRPGSLIRLELPPEVLAACRADLADVRLIDERGIETPFVVDRGADAQPPQTKLKSLVAVPLAVERQKAPRPGVEPVVREAYHLATPSAPPGGGTWDLSFEVNAREFVRRLDVEAILADGKRVELKTNDSIFRLKDGHGERLRVPLPTLPGPKLIVTLTGEDTTSIEPRFRFEAVERVAPVPELLVPLSVTRSSTSNGRTLVELARPAGIVPSALRIGSITAAFNRPVEVRDSGGTGPTLVLGRASVFRIPGDSQLEELEVPLDPARGSLLSVSIEDGDSPPLEAPTFRAVVRTPTLVFALPSGASIGGMRLFYGGGRVHARRYDLEALAATRGTMGQHDASTRARAERTLADRNLASSARLADLRDNPTFDRAPALAFAQHAGAPLDVSAYAYRRRIELQPSTDGLAEVVLSARDVSLLRRDFGDARIVDATNRQWPFLLESARHEELVPLEFGIPERSNTQSRRTLVLPFSPLAANALVIETPEAFFTRPFQIEGVLTNGKRRQLASGQMTRAGGDAVTPLVLEFGPEPVRALEFVTEDGDNVPLGISTIQARVRVPSLYVVAKPGSYQLLLANPAAVPAHYDIETARSLILSAASETSTPLALEPNPSYRATTRLVTAVGPERVALWVALMTAVLLLGTMTLRLVRREPLPTKGEGEAD